MPICTYEPWYPYFEWLHIIDVIATTCEHSCPVGWGDELHHLTNMDVDWVGSSCHCDCVVCEFGASPGGCSGIHKHSDTYTVTGVVSLTHDNKSCLYPIEGVCSESGGADVRVLLRRLGGRRLLRLIGLIWCFRMRMLGGCGLICFRLLVVRLSWSWVLILLMLVRCILIGLCFVVCRGRWLGCRRFRWCIRMCLWWVIGVVG